MRVAFLGVGSMGAPMATNLARSGHTLTVWNRTRSRAEGVEGAVVAASPREAALGADVAITMLSDDDAVEAVVFGADGLLAGLPAGAVHACMSTISPVLSRRLAEAHAGRGQRYVAAPVFGRPEAAEAAQLWVLTSGDGDARAACASVFETLGQGVIVAGPRPEQANVVKLAGNFLLASAIEAMAEAFTLVRSYDVDTAEFLRTIATRLFRSPIYENYGGMIEAQRYEPAGFSLRHGLKDIRYALGAADRAEVPLPLASLLHDRLLSATARGWADLDWASLARVAAVEAGE